MPFLSRARSAAPTHLRKPRARKEPPGCKGISQFETVAQELFGTQPHFPPLVAFLCPIWRWNRQNILVVALHQRAGAIQRRLPPLARRAAVQCQINRGAFDPRIRGAGNSKGGIDPHSRIRTLPIDAHGKGSRLVQLGKALLLTRILNIGDEPVPRRTDAGILFLMKASSCVNVMRAVWVLRYILPAGRKCAASHGVCQSLFRRIGRGHRGVPGSQCAVEKRANFLRIGAEDNHRQ
jgi:hypothetical protein